MCPLVVIEPWMLVTCQWEGLTLRVIGCEYWLVTVVQGLLCRPDLREQDSLY